MERDPFGEDVLCFLCDYGLFALIALLVVLMAFLRWQGFLPPLTSAPALATPSATAAAVATAATAPAETLPTLAATASAVSSPTPGLPTFRVVFIAVNWQGNLQNFQIAAEQQAHTFAAESPLGDYFQFAPIIAEAAMTGQNLTDPALVDLVVAFAIQKGIRADRYVGLTNADLSPDGYSEVVGWTSGGEGMVAEAQDQYVTAHELGHTFGLCDEYSYADWSRQNQEYSGGCPNPYPPNCPQLTDSAVTCDGNPAAGGANSIMGPAGLPGDYAYNAPSLSHLRETFRALAQMEQTSQ